MVHLLRFWAQDVYQVLPDSCAGWPAVNYVSNRPLLLLIVRISVPVEKWDCCGQTQAIDLWLAHDLPAARVKEWEWRPGWSLHDTPCLAPVPGKATVVIYTAGAIFSTFHKVLNSHFFTFPLLFFSNLKLCSHRLSAIHLLCFSTELF